MSRETDGIRAYLDGTGVVHHVTDINTPGVHSPTSRHYYPGTWAPPVNPDLSRGDRGEAIDVAYSAGQYDSPELLAIFAAFGPVESKLTELIHSGAPYFIHLGRRYPIASLDPALKAAHHNHVHVAVAQGTVLAAENNKSQPTGADMALAYVTSICPTGGYYEVKTDNGGVDAYDGAPFFGSLPALNVKPVQPVIGLTPFLVNGQVRGYWLYSTDGGVFAFGAAPFLDCCADHPEWSSPGQLFIGLVQTGGFNGDAVTYKQLRRQPNQAPDEFDEYHFPVG